MHGAILHGPGDVRYEQRDDPTITAPTDAIIRVSVTCVCGSDLWDYRGIKPAQDPTPIGHEYCGIVEDVGSDVTLIKPGQFVIGSFIASDNTCPHCRAGFQSACQHAQEIGPIGAQAEYLRVPLADGTLVATPDIPDDAMLPSLLAASDVLGTGWFAAVSADVAPGMTVAVVGDGAVGQLGVLAAQQLGAERIIIFSRHETRQQLAQQFGATDIITQRGDEGVNQLKDLTHGIGADAVLECVGTTESLDQAIRSARPGATVGNVGLPHNITIPAEQLFQAHVSIRGGPAPVRRFLPDLINRINNDTINPGKVFDLTLPLRHLAEGYEAMNSRTSIKTLLRP